MEEEWEPSRKQCSFLSREATDKKCFNIFRLSIGMENARSHVTRIASKFYFRNQLSERGQIRQSGQFNPVCDKHKTPCALWTE